MKAAIIALALLIALFAQSHAALNQDDETCSKDAGEFFRNKFEHAFEKGTTTYRSHYNKTLNTCFVSISIHGYRKNNIRIDSIYIVFFDLSRKKELGSLFQVHGDTEYSLPDCYILNRPFAKCSHAEWDAFVQRYREE